MTEKKSVPKLGIYVPDNRLRDVEKWRETLNFSEVFWRAFDAEVDRRVQEKKITREINQVVERMRELKREQSRALSWRFREGHKAGRDWARAIAKPDQLNRLAARFESRLAEDVYPWQQYLFGPDRDPPADILEVVLGRQPNQKAVGVFWASVLGADRSDPRLHDADFLHGFLAGAVELWNEVKDLI